MDNNMGGFYFGEGHVMEPHRLSMTHNLVLAYGLYRKMEVYRPRRASEQELKQFHSVEYVNFLSRITPDNRRYFKNELSRFNVGMNTDCPLFDGLFEFCQLYTGGSIDGARKLLSGSSDIVINWPGGLHHAKKSEASGFCYTNDIVLAILELLKYFPRVLYIDIDLHHGDGVEEAFYVTDRVLTVSFHKYGDNFFPGTGSVWDKGFGNGEYYAVNFPLKDGMDDQSYENAFQPVVRKAIEMFRPSAIVLQCGVDGLANDSLGSFNMTIEGHASCVQFVKGFNIPMLVLGGGGYNMCNVARCWAFETGILLNLIPENNIPYNDYWEYFAPQHKLLFSANKSVKNHNTPSYIGKVTEKIMENLRCLSAAPSVQMQEIPPIFYCSDDEDELDTDQRFLPHGKQADGEFYDDCNDQGMECH
ncbi:unnamed protein product [Agarophyton chilense]